MNLHPVGLSKVILEVGSLWNTLLTSTNSMLAGNCVVSKVSINFTRALIEFFLYRLPDMKIIRHHLLVSRWNWYYRSNTCYFLIDIRNIMFCNRLFRNQKVKHGKDERTAWLARVYISTYTLREWTDRELNSKPEMHVETRFELV